MKLKRCPACGQLRTLDNFGIRNNKEKFPDGHYTICKMCRAIREDRLPVTTSISYLDLLEILEWMEICGFVYSYMDNNGEIRYGLTTLGHQYLHKKKKGESYRGLKIEKWYDLIMMEEGLF